MHINIYMGLLCVDMLMLCSLGHDEFVFFLFYITGDLKDCCAYVNRSYCAISVLKCLFKYFFFTLQLLLSCYFWTFWFIFFVPNLNSIRPRLLWTIFTVDRLRNIGTLASLEANTSPSLESTHPISGGTLTRRKTRMLRSNNGADSLYATKRNVTIRRNVLCAW